MFRRVRSSIAAAVLGIVGSAPGLAQDSPDMRLREGVEAYRSRRAADAITPLRIAAFGLLDRPRELCEALIYLALAQDASGHRLEADAAAEKLSSIESRFPACSEAPVDPPARSQFDERFRRAGSSASAPVRATTPGPVPAPPAATPRNARPAEDPQRVLSRPAASAGTLGGSQTETPPRVTKSFPAVYPRAAREARLAGIAVVRVLVSESGRPVRLEAVRGPRPLTEAAMAAIRRWTFEPARRNGREVEAWLEIEVPFQP